jgi:ankyrin repeat protein
LRLLQGALVRHSYDVVRCPEFLISIKEATSHLRTSASTVSVRSTNPTNPILGDVLETVVCEAIVSLCGEDILLQADKGRWPNYGVRDHGIEGWKLLTACKIGDVELLSTCYHSFNAQNLPKKDSHNVLRSCLSTAIKEDWHAAFYHLLRSGMDQTTLESPIHLDKIPLFAATMHGQIDHLRALLDTDNYVQNSPSLYEAALVRAAEHPSQSCRAQMVEMLLKQREHHRCPRLRHEVIFAACRLNDVALLRRMLEDGHVDLYSKNACMTMQVRQRSALTAAAAVNGIDCLKLILTAAPPEEVHCTMKAEAMAQLRIAYVYATMSKNLESVKVLLPHLSAMSVQEKYEFAAEVEGGISALEEICGPRDGSVPTAPPICN